MELLVWTTPLDKGMILCIIITYIHIHSANRTSPWSIPHPSRLSSEFQPCGESAGDDFLPRLHVGVSGDHISC